MKHYRIMKPFSVGQLAFKQGKEIPASELREGQLPSLFRFGFIEECEAGKPASAPDKTESKDKRNVRE